MEARITLEQFVSSSAKQLKEPVQAIQGLIRIAEYYPVHEEIRKCLRLITACTHAIEHIIHRTDEFISIEQYQPSLSRLQANDLAQLLHVAFAKSLSSNQVRMELEIQVDEVVTDADSLINIFRNIMSSAHSPHADELDIKTIIVNLRVQDGHLEMVIRDQKGSIAFDLFAKGDSDEVGMGLFLAKRLARHIGASISLMASSEAGTSIIVRFPDWIRESIDR